MAKKDDNGAGIAAGILVILFIGAFFLIKWTVIGLIIIISTIVVWIINICRKHSKNKYIRNIVEDIFKESKLKPTSKITIKELKEKIGIFDLDIYKELVENHIRQRGYDYFISNKVKNINQNDNVYKSIVAGTKDYNVSIEFDKEDNNKVVNCECNCKYYQDDKKNCKHIYATLVKIKGANNLTTIHKEINSFSSKISTMGQKYLEYVNENKDKLKTTPESALNFDNFIDEYKIKLQNALGNINEYKYDEDVLLNTLKELIEYSYYFDNEFRKFIIKSGKMENPVSFERVILRENNNKVGMGDVVTGTLLFNALDKKINENKDYDEELEKEMDEYCLEDWQKDLVRNGEYNSWNFEEDGELDEDDYYYEDSDINKNE